MSVPTIVRCKCGSDAWLAYDDNDYAGAIVLTREDVEPLVSRLAALARDRGQDPEFELAQGIREIIDGFRAAGLHRHGCGRILYNGRGRHFYSLLVEADDASGIFRSVLGDAYVGRLEGEWDDEGLGVVQWRAGSESERRTFASERETLRCYHEQFERLNARGVLSFSQMEGMDGIVHRYRRGEGEDDGA